MFKDMKTGPCCRQNCYESNISVEMLWSKLRRLCVNMTDMVKLLLVQEIESCLGSPAVEACFPQCLHLRPVSSQNLSGSLLCVPRQSLGKG